ncbi:hypothetical protein [Moraxella boevrei]|uniref:hypothetical protein n=1 Tax=Faucicola boevrei TaxID=346665 RepID=UPI003736AC55
MLKPIFTVATLVLALTACSKNSETTEKTTASSPAPTASVVATTSSSVASVAPTASVATIASTTATVTTTEQKVEIASTATVSPVAPKADAKSAENVALKADLNTLFKTLNDIDKKAQAKQAEMEKKMQTATSPAEQQQFLKEVVAQLENQKATLQKLTFNDKRVTQARDKMLENINDSRKAMEIMAKNPNATPETNPEIGKSMQKAQKSAEQVRDMLSKLIQEAGIEPTKH